MTTVLSIAGSDSSAGAGIQQDLKTIMSLGCYGATVITAITSQNTLGVQHVMPVPASVVKSQMKSVLSDLDVSAIKIGMIPNREVAEAVVESLQKEFVGKSNNISSPTGGVRGGLGAIVYDPVMISTSGRQLMDEDCLGYVIENLVPLCTLITPNMPEAAHLRKASPTLLREGTGGAYLIKGGHAEGDEMTDTLYMPDGTIHRFTSPKIDTTNLHGTGCTLSSAIASYLAMGYTLPDAVGKAKETINKGIEGGRHLHIGSGNGPLWLF